MGESLAGLFIVETLLAEPVLFDHYVALDPSVWWNGGALVGPRGDRAGAEAERDRESRWTRAAGEMGPRARRC